MQGKIGTERGKHSDWCARQLGQQRRMNGWHTIGWRSGERGRHGGEHGKGAEHDEGQVKWQSRADCRTPKKCETE